MKIDPVPRVAKQRGGFLAPALDFCTNQSRKMLRSGPRRKRYIAHAVGVFLIFWWLKSRFSVIPSNLSEYNYHSAASTVYFSQASLERIPLRGFYNNGIPGKVSCDDLEYDETIDVQQSFHLHGNLTQVAKAVESHPLVDYEGKNRSLPFEQLVQENWAQLAGASVWLPDRGVYLAVTRVIYVPSGVLHWPTISFIRGQIFDEEWNHLDGYTMTWNGDQISFPTVFEIPVTFEKGDIFFGPEDPRIILQEGVKGAEPVIVFNMRHDPPGWPRAMWIHRPFSNFTTILTILDGEDHGIEKNWAPFFHVTTGLSADADRLPSQHLHFVYSFKPLRILRCQLLNGHCKWVFRQEVSDQFAVRHGDTHGDMRGGTNFVPVPIDTRSGIRIYAGFPRTHIDWGCVPNSTYRPELVILSSVNSEFQITYASDAIDFGHAVFDENSLQDPCGEGHILIANSISRWDLQDGRDVMTLSLTVADKTVQIIRLHGLWRLIRRLPHIGEFLKHDVSQGGEALWNFRWSAVGNDVLACSVEAASNASLRNAIQAGVEVENQGSGQEKKSVEETEDKEKSDEEEREKSRGEETEDGEKRDEEESA